MANKKAQKFYIDEAGEKSRHASEAAVALAFEFTNGHAVTVKPSDFPENILHCAMFHGLSQKIGDGMASSKSVDDAIERVEAVIENLGEGTWIDRAEGAVRTSLIAEALHRIKKDKYPTVEDAAKTIKEWDNDKRKQVLDSEKGVPALIAAYAEIQAERAAERAKKAAEAASEASGEGLEDL